MKTYTLNLSASLENCVRPVSRLAPTPSGFLHVGNAYSFLLTWLLVRRLDGFLHLRIDDLDVIRMKPECLDDLFRQLKWLGLDYDSGPEGPDEVRTRFSQSLRIPQYELALLQLREKGMLYACRCSRKQYLALSSDGLYPGSCRDLELSFSEPSMAWRLRVPESCLLPTLRMNVRGEPPDLSREMGDCVVRRKDGLPAYQIASLIDDLENGCNLIVRGADLYPSSLAQYFLAEILERDQFRNSIFVHHQLVTDESGRKLSKTRGALALKTLQQQRPNPVFLYRDLAQWLHLPPAEINNLQELLDAFLSVSLDDLEIIR